MMEPSNSRAEVHEGEGGVEYDGEVELPLDANACPDYEDLNNTEDASSLFRDPADGHAQFELYGGGIDAYPSSANHNAAMFDVDGDLYPRDAFPSTSAASTRPATLHQTPRIIVRDDEPRDRSAPTTSTWNDAHLQSTSSAMPATCTRRQPPVDRKLPKKSERNERFLVRPNGNSVVSSGNPVNITPIRSARKLRASTSTTTSNSLAADEVHTSTPSKRGRKRKEPPLPAESSISSISESAALRTPARDLHESAIGSVRKSTRVHQPNQKLLETHDKKLRVHVQSSIERTPKTRRAPIERSAPDAPPATASLPSSLLQQESQPTPKKRGRPRKIRTIDQEVAPEIETPPPANDAEVVERVPSWSAPTSVLVAPPEAPNSSSVHCRLVDRKDVHEASKAAELPKEEPSENRPSSPAAHFSENEANWVKQEEPIFFKLVRRRRSKGQLPRDKETFHQAKEDAESYRSRVRASYNDAQRRLQRVEPKDRSKAALAKIAAVHHFYSARDAPIPPHLFSNQWELMERIAEQVNSALSEDGRGGLDFLKRGFLATVFAHHDEQQRKIRRQRQAEQAEKENAKAEQTSNQGSRPSSVLSNAQSGESRPSSVLQCRTQSFENLPVQVEEDEARVANSETIDVCFEKEAASIEAASAEIKEASESSVQQTITPPDDFSYEVDDADFQVEILDDLRPPTPQPARSPTPVVVEVEPVVCELNVDFVRQTAEFAEASIAEANFAEVAAVFQVPPVPSTPPPAAVEQTGAKKRKRVSFLLDGLEETTDDRGAHLAIDEPLDEQPSKRARIEADADEHAAGDDEPAAIETDVHLDDLVESMPEQEEIPDPLPEIVMPTEENVEVALELQPQKHVRFVEEVKVVLLRRSASPVHFSTTIEAILQRKQRELLEEVPPHIPVESRTAEQHAVDEPGAVEEEAKADREAEGAQEDEEEGKLELSDVGEVDERDYDGDLSNPPSDALHDDDLRLRPRRRTKKRPLEKADEDEPEVTAAEHEADLQRCRARFERILQGRVAEEAERALAENMSPELAEDIREIEAVEHEVRLRYATPELRVAEVPAPELPMRPLPPGDLRLQELRTYVEALSDVPEGFLADALFNYHEGPLLCVPVRMRDDRFDDYADLLKVPAIRKLGSEKLALMFMHLACTSDFHLDWTSTTIAELKAMEEDEAPQSVQLVIVDNGDEFESKPRIARARVTCAPLPRLVDNSILPDELSERTIHGTMDFISTLPDRRMSIASRYAGWMEAQRKAALSLTIDRLLSVMKNIVSIELLLYELLDANKGGSILRSDGSWQRNFGYLGTLVSLHGTNPQVLLRALEALIRPACVQVEDSDSELLEWMGEPKVAFANDYFEPFAASYDAFKPTHRTPPVSSNRKIKRNCRHRSRPLGTRFCVIVIRRGIKRKYPFESELLRLVENGHFSSEATRDLSEFVEPPFKKRFVGRSLVHPEDAPKSPSRLVDAATSPEAPLFPPAPCFDVLSEEEEEEEDLDAGAGTSSMDETERLVSLYLPKMVQLFANSSFFTPVRGLEKKAVEEEMTEKLAEVVRDPSFDTEDPSALGLETFIEINAFCAPRPYRFECSDQKEYTRRVLQHAHMLRDQVEKQKTMLECLRKPLTGDGYLRAHHLARKGMSPIDGRRPPGGHQSLPNSACNSDTEAEVAELTRSKLPRSGRARDFHRYGGRFRFDLYLKRRSMATFEGADYDDPTPLQRTLDTFSVSDPTDNYQSLID